MTDSMWYVSCRHTTVSDKYRYSIYTYIPVCIPHSITNPELLGQSQLLEFDIAASKKERNLQTIGKHRTQTQIHNITTFHNTIYRSPQWIGPLGEAACFSDSRKSFRRIARSKVLRGKVYVMYAYVSLCQDKTHVYIYICIYI